jgi:hypothetical protein
MGLVGIVAAATSFALSQSAPVERQFPQPKAAIEKAIRSLQGNMAGRLPVLEGFAKPSDHPLDRYQRGYYQATAEVLSTSSGGSIVRIRAKVTAWYTDPTGTHSGYQLLDSNGRVELDLLDQLSEQVANVSSDKAAPTSAPLRTSDEHPAAPQPERTFPKTSGSLSSLRPTLNGAEPTTEKTADPASKANSGLQAEADNLEQILKNTAHPKNLIAVKKSGTPVVPTPSLTAKPQFLASMHDEFELLDFNANWVHVRISGLSRGWIWRNSVEMPDGLGDTAGSSAPAVSSVADLFHVIREEMAPFPGDWEPLRGKNVKIISVQKIDEAAKNVGSKERLEYAKFLMDKNYSEIANKSQNLQGVVVVFDSADGGMIGASLPALQQWRAGTLTDSAFWHKCFFDPPEALDSSDSSGSN